MRLNEPISKQILSVVVVMTAIVMLTGARLVSSYVAAENDSSVVDQITITVPVACTLSGMGMNSHNANINNGVLYGSLYEDSETGEMTYEGVGLTIISAFCNDNNGFSIYAAGYTGDEVGGANSTKLLGANTGSSNAIVTGTDLGSSQDVSNWEMVAYKITDSGDTSSGNAFVIDNSFQWGREVPGSYAKVAHKNAATTMDTVNGGIKLGTTYFVYISKTQPADTYSGKVKYTLIHPSYADSYGCNPNGNTIGEILCMQDINSTNKSTVLDSMILEKQYALKDKRDNKTYTVAKLKDGNVWMTQNLDLDLDSTKTFTSEDTDLGWNGNSYSVASWTPMRSTYAASDKRWCEDGERSASGLMCNVNYTPESYDVGNLYWNGTLDTALSLSDWEGYIESCAFNSTTKLFENCDESLNPASLFIVDQAEPQYHLGNYYNWTAAIASNDSSAYVTRNQDIDQSICPRGWMLPRGGDVVASPMLGSFQNLFEQYGWTDDSYEMADDVRAYEGPFHFVLGGMWRGIMEYVGGDGYHWSSTVNNESTVYDDYVYSGPYVMPDDTSNDRAEGFSVRCVTR